MKEARRAVVFPCVIKGGLKMLAEGRELEGGVWGVNNVPQDLSEAMGKERREGSGAEELGEETTGMGNRVDLELSREEGRRERDEG